jgi:DNA-binding Lrp family transcriptional regulator
MVSAIILLKVEPSHIKPLAERLAEFREISEVFSVAGSYDVVAVARVARNEDLADLVTERLVKLHGIQESETLIAFRSYGRKEVEAGFSLGAT